MKKSKKINDLLLSGDFTLAYHDNHSCTLHKGIFKSYEKLPVDPDGDIECSLELGGYSDGYIPEEVEALVKALGGKVVSV